MATALPQPSPTFLGTKRGKLTLALLCLAAFLDFVDATIVNIAMPSIGHHLHFSVQDLQWVVSAYLLTYGGLLLLGGRAADLLGRRRLFVSGTVLFGLSSLACGLANTGGVLVGSRLAQGIGAAMMSPAALSILTTTFHEGNDRFKAFGVYSGMVGLASASGMIFGGLLTEGPGWRWIFFVNLPVCAVIIFGAYRLLSADHPTTRRSGFDTIGAILATAGMLLLVYGLVRAPEVGWGSSRTIGSLAGAFVLLAAFALNEARHKSPLAPPQFFKIKGVTAANMTQLVATAGFYTTFFFLTVYIQNVLDYGPIKAGFSFVPVTVGFGIASGAAAQLFPRVGTRPVIAAGGLIAAGAIFYLSRIPVDGSYVTDLLPGLVIMAIGLGFVFTGVQTAANAGVPPEQAGLAAALVTTAWQLGGAIGIAVFSAIATARTNNLLASHVAPNVALTEGFQRGLAFCSLCLVAAAIIALRTTAVRPPAPGAAPADLTPEVVGS